MPQTINGIGTHYYGKANLRKRPGVCDSCGVLADLSSYDTRLWFVIVFIPVIPLGKKRIIDDCPRCRRHRVLGLAEWEQSRRAALEAAMQQVVQKPGDVQALMDLHGLCLLYGEWEKADKLEERLGTEFPKDSKVQLHLASAHGYRGRTEQAQQCLARARELDPEIEVPLVKAVEPPRGRSRLRKILYGTLALLLLSLLVIADRIKFSERTLHVVNGYPVPLNVRIEGVGGRQIPPLSREEMDIPEGTYTAQVSGPVSGEIPFTISSQLFVRLFDSRVFVLNPGGAGLLLRESILYSVRRSGPDEGKPGYTVHFGHPFEVFEGINYPFKEAPREIQTKGSGVIEKWQLRQYTDSALDIYEELLGDQRSAEALGLAEWAIDAHPERAAFLSAYAEAGELPAHKERVERFLKERISRRPVDIVLHRAYQGLHGGPRRPGLEAEYEALLKAEPASSALLYLRGRLVSGLKAGAAYFERALKADPQNAYAHYALGYGRYSQGHWQEAWESVVRAQKLDEGNGFFEGLDFEIRLGLGQHEALEQELLEELTRRNYADPGSVFRLVKLIALRGKKEEALRHGEEFKKARGSKGAAEAARLTPLLRCQALYAAGEFAGLEAEALKGDAQALLPYRIQALVELGRIDEVAALETQDPDDPFTLLTRSIAWSLKGDEAKAKELRGKAAELFKAGDRDLVPAAAMLGGAKAPALEAVLDLEGTVQRKAILLAALVRAFPEAGAEFRAAARNLNVSLNFPRHLLSRALGR